MGESRRKFIKKLVLSANPEQRAAAKQEKRAVVCVFLRGGADTLNMLVPYADSQYYKVRPTIAIARPGSGNKNAAIKLDDFYGFHPKLQALYPVFAEGELLLVQGVGSDNPTGSHFEAQDQMERGECFGKSIGGGWLGRYLRFLSSEKLTALSAVAIGEAVPESFRGAPVTSVIRKLDEIKISVPDSCTDAFCQALSSMYKASSAAILSQPGQSTFSLLKRVESLRGAHAKEPSGAGYPESEFAMGLKEIARLVKADLGLEVACIDLGGWDTHFVQGGAEGLQSAQIEILGNGLAAFWKDLGSWRSRTLVIVMTEFGRRIYENGSLGTDHGRGFALMALGTYLNGGKVLGKYPGLQDDQYELGPGGMKITSDYRSVLSELLSFDSAQIEAVFPGLEQTKLGLVLS